PTPPRAVAPARPSYAAAAARVATTRPRRRNPRPSPRGAWPKRSIGRVAFFSRVLGVGAGDPVLGPLPAQAEPVDGVADSFVRDAREGQPALAADLGRQFQGPD